MDGGRKDYGLLYSTVLFITVVIVDTVSSLALDSSKGEGRSVTGEAWGAEAPSQCSASSIPYFRAYCTKYEYSTVWYVLSCCHG